MKELHEYLNNQESPRFLIIRLKPIGDTVLLTPVFRNLKRLYPSSTIDVVVYPFVTDILEHNPYIDNVIVLKRTASSKLLFYLKSIFRSYDVVMDFINNPTSAAIAFCTRSHCIIGGHNRRNFFYTHRIKDSAPVYSSIRCLRKLEALGLDVLGDYYPELFIGPDDDAEAEMFRHSIGDDVPVIGIFASAKYTTKKYPAAHFAEVGRQIVEASPVRVLFLFGRNDYDTFDIISSQVDGSNRVYCHPPNTRLGYLCALISKLDFMIVGDTGPKHIATALGIPTLTIFSASNEKVWNPPDRLHYPIIRKAMPCAPCNLNSCPELHMRCMTELDPTEVSCEALSTMKRLGILKSAEDVSVRV